MVEKEPKIEIWKTLKKFIGQDLSKVSLPVAFNEPLSALQKLTNNLEY